MKERLPRGESSTRECACTMKSWEVPKFLVLKNQTNMASLCAICNGNSQRDNLVQGWSGAKRRLAEAAGVVPWPENGGVHSSCRRKVARLRKHANSCRNDQV